MAPPMSSLADSAEKLKPATPVAASPAAQPASTGAAETNGRFAGGAADRAAAGAPSAAPAVNAPIAASSPAMRSDKEEAGNSQLRDDVSAVTDQPQPGQV